nr:MAG TPA: hypothetical protein [Caudoviricetes sp.]
MRYDKSNAKYRLSNRPRQTIYQNKGFIFGN